MHKEIFWCLVWLLAHNIHPSFTLYRTYRYHHTTPRKRALLYFYFELACCSHYFLESVTSTFLYDYLLRDTCSKYCTAVRLREAFDGIERTYDNLFSLACQCHWDCSLFFRCLLSFLHLFTSFLLLEYLNLPTYRYAVKLLYGTCSVPAGPCSTYTKKYRTTWIGTLNVMLACLSRTKIIDLDRN